jgi:transcriptional regulator with PAS, ATPase and Fis domain
VLFAVSNLTLISALGVILIDLTLYATLEKHSKESWVIRETTEKSFKTFLNMVDENPKEVFIIDKSGALQFINKRAQDLLLKSTKNITSFFDIVHKRN